MEIKTNIIQNLTEPSFASTFLTICFACGDAKPFYGETH